LGVILLDLIGFRIVISILPFLSPALGANKMDIALIVVTYAIGAGLCGPLWGRLRPARIPPGAARLCTARCNSVVSRCHTCTDIHSLQSLTHTNAQESKLWRHSFLI
jgi:hypothetical protein